MPGTSGVLSPYSNIDGLYFDNSDEPQKFMFNLMKAAAREAKKGNKIYVGIDAADEKICYEMLEELQKFSHENLSFYGTSRTDKYITVIEKDPEEEIDDVEEDVAEEVSVEE